jgi:hypothetical protein
MGDPNTIVSSPLDRTFTHTSSPCHLQHFVITTLAWSNDEDFRKEKGAFQKHDCHAPRYRHEATIVAVICYTQHPWSAPAIPSAKRKLPIDVEVACRSGPAMDDTHTQGKREKGLTHYQLCLVPVVLPVSLGIAGLIGCEFHVRSSQTYITIPLQCLLSCQLRMQTIKLIKVNTQSHPVGSWVIQQDSVQ